MSGLLDFYHFYFAPIGQPWDHGAVYGNIIAVPFCALLAYVVVFRKLVECQECHRFAYHHVPNTHHKVCNKHNTPEVYKKLEDAYRKKHPESHKLLKSTA